MKSWITADNVMVLFLVCGLTGMAAQSVHAQTAIFEDSFNVPSLDSNKWNTYICSASSKSRPWGMQAGQPQPSSEIGNEYYADYELPSLITTGDGLSLKVQRGSSAKGFAWIGSVVCSYPTDNDFGSGKIHTAGFTFTNAHIEVRAKLPYSGNGVWPAIWFLHGPGSNGGEIDLVEGGFLCGTNDPDTIMACNVHTAGNSQTFVKTGINLSADYHVYGMDYREGRSVKMYLDGVLVASYTNNVPTGSYCLILNNSVANAAASSWHSQTNAATPNPNYMLVSSVRVSFLPTGSTTADAVR